MIHFIGEYAEIAEENRERVEELSRQLIACCVQRIAGLLRPLGGGFFYRPLRSLRSVEMTDMKPLRH